MRSRLVNALWVLTFVVVSSLWCLTAAEQIGPTFDEPFYLESGLHFWRTGSFGPLLVKGTMPLPIAVCTAPVRAYELWRGQPIDLATEFDLALRLARPGTLLFWWVLLGYGFVAGARLGGVWGGRFAVALLACEPTLLAHASLATTDIAIAACLLVFAVHFQANREAGWWRRVGLCALLYGVALFAKASALVFGVLIMLTLEWVRVWSQQPAATSAIRKVRDCLSTLLARPFRRDVVQIVALGLGFTFVVCGCDWKAEPSFIAWAESLPDGPLARGLVWTAHHATVFSNAGVAIVRQIKHNMQGHGAYLLGTTSPRALWYFFPVALTIKLALPLLLLPLLLTALSPRSLRNAALALAAVLLLFSLNCRVQIGVRLVMPLIAFLAVGVGVALGDALTRLEAGWQRRTLFGAATVGVGWMAVAVALVWPNGLCYVNELWGGTRHAPEYVSGSDYDWGQGVRDLDRWRERHHAEVALLYYGTDPLARSDHFTYLHADHLPAKEQLRATVGDRDLAVSMCLLYGPRLKHDRLNAVLDHLRTQRPAERTTFFVIYRFGPSGERAAARSGN